MGDTVSSVLFDGLFVSDRVDNERAAIYSSRPADFFELTLDYSIVKYYMI